VDSNPPPRPPSYDKKIGLVLQGGGALGSYQAGVYEVLASSEYLPDWVAGISIGAINAVIIAGNAPEDRLKRLRVFWNGITTPTSLWSSALVGSPVLWQQNVSALTALMFGQPGFFTPRTLQYWFSSEKFVSYYDTSALTVTLERLVDFDRINNAKDVRLSVGAVNVRTGQFAYFDSAHITIRPEHIMASCALPPGFPPVEIDGEHYWDGGLFSNTPLGYVLDYSPRRSRLTFQVDVFQSQGRLPTNLDEVAERDKDIRYSSRTQIFSNAFRDRHDVPSMSCTNCCRRIYWPRNKPSGSMSWAVLPRWISCSWSIARLNPRAGQKTMNSAARPWKSGGSREFPTREPSCIPRHGSRQCQRNWACECST
jgi:NTE family protein